MVLRYWDPADAALLKHAIDSSLEHLRRWMPWAEKDPDDFSAIVQWLRACHGKFDLGQYFNYGSST